MAYDVYSRIKKVAIELHNFSFFHGPSEAPETDDRFVGREGLIEKLTAFLTRSNSKSGAYLVTGYRGMGKTSFVNQVIDRISSCHKPLPQTERFLRMIIFLAILSLLISEYVWITYICYGIAALSAIITPLYIIIKRKYYLLDPLLTRNSKWRISKIGSISHNIGVIAVCFTLSQQLKTLFQPVVQLFRQGEQQNDWSELTFLFSVGILGLWTVLHSLVYNKVVHKTLNYWSRIKLYISSLNKVVLKINLGFGELKHIDILKLVASNLEDAYIDFVKFTRRNWIYHLLKFVVLLLLVVVFLKLTPVKKYHESLGEQFYTDLIFPSNSPDMKYVNIFLNKGYDEFWKKNNKVIEQVDSIKNAHMDFNLTTTYYVDYSDSGLNRDTIFHWNYKNDRKPQSIKSWLEINLTALEGKLDSISGKYKDYNLTNVYYVKYRDSTLNRDIYHYLTFKEGNITTSLTSEFERYRSNLKNKLDTIVNQHNKDTINIPCNVYCLVEKGSIKDSILLVSYVKKDSAKIKLKIDSSVTTLVKALDSNSSLPKDFKLDIIYDFKNEEKPKLNGGTITSMTCEEGDMPKSFSSEFEKYKTALFKDSDSWILKHLDYVTPITHYVDFMLQTGYRELDKRLFASLLGNVFGDKIQYITFVYLFLFYLCFNYGFIRNPFIVNTHKSVLKEIKRLNESIKSQVSVQSGVEQSGTSKHGFPGFKRMTAKNYPIAGVREIDLALNEILESINTVPKHTIRPEIIIIFDELDKIEPLPLSEPGAGNQNHSGKHLPNEEIMIRLRQQAIMSVLKNLKSFITTAKAKFIFIAGREMNDASLADVSDREFFINTIFNGTLYVDSFLHDGVAHADSEVTGLTQQFVCQFLIPDSFQRKNKAKYPKPNLQLLYSYLSTEKFNVDDELISQLKSNPASIKLSFKRMKSIVKPKKVQMEDVQINKVMNEVMNFIMYLTYRSNGTPKKLINLFDTYVHPYNKISNRSDFIVVNRDKSKEKFFLVFHFHDQYSFGMVTYLCNPFFYMINQELRDYEDKLLVSLSFMLDHIYKYHNVGFSWEDLESSPELTDIYKAPQSRELYTRIVRHLTNTQIEEIKTGLYDYKFSKRIADEINILCRLNARESAAFNFTLDESLMVKQHYKTKLKSFLEKYQSYLSNPKPDLLKSLSFLYMIVGDLHFYDEEYDDAILYYSDATQLYGEDSFSKLPTDLLITQIKNTLKLGLAFEKRKNYDMALLCYGKLRARIKEFSENTKKYEESIRLTINERLSLLYQPILAYLHVLEEASTTGITDADVKEIIEEYRELNRFNISDASSITLVEFYDRVGDALFFKNGELYINKGTSQIRQGQSEIVSGPSAAKEFYELSVKELSSLMKHVGGDPHESQMSILSVLFGFLRSLCNPPKNSEFSHLSSLTGYLQHGKRKIGRNEKILRIAANLLTNLADTYLCFAKEGDIEIEDMKSIFNYYKEGKDQSLDTREYKTIFGIIKGCDSTTDDYINRAIVYYLMAGFYYRTLADHKEYAHQLTNILKVLQAHLQIREVKEKKEDVKNIYNFAKNTLLPEIVSAHQRAYNSFHLVEAKEYNNIATALKKKDNGNYKKDYSLLTNSINWEVKEAIITVKAIGLKNGQKDVQSKGVEQKKNRRYSSLYSFYNRTLELDYYERENSVIYKGAEQLDKPMRDIIKLWEEIDTSLESIEKKIAELAKTPNENDQKTEEEVKTPNEKDQKTEAKDKTLIHNLEYIRNYYVELDPKIYATLIYQLNRMLTIVNRGNLLIIGDQNGTPPTRSTTHPTTSSVRIEDDVKEIIEIYHQIKVKEEIKPIKSIIYDSIFCMHHLIRECKITGVSYDVNHSFLAEAYYRLAKWCEKRDELNQSNNSTEGDDCEDAETLQIILGTTDDSVLSPAHNYEMALNHYKLAIDTHTGGVAYKDMIHDMIYLNDDYNDNHYHFCAALERYHLNNGVFHKKIEDINKELKDLNDSFRESLSKPANYI